MTSRKLLLYHAGVESPLFPRDFIVPGWEIIPIEAPLQDRCDPCVGLALVGCCDEAALGALERLVLGARGIEWIALVDPMSLTSIALCQLIATSFYDHHTLPVDVERLLVTLGRAYGKATLRRNATPCSRDTGPCGIVGASAVMQKLYRDIGKLQATDAPVLISGESGTGKEHVAGAIHDLSVRRAAPFVAVNCGAIPSHLIQTELFGHEKGAFTGAHQRKIGRLESAAGGTIFLDEIGDLALELQVNLLRFLQDKAIERVGSNQRIPLDVRVLAATHVDLEEAIAKGRFREDLYYRINVLQCRIAPLRERQGDIELLAHVYLERFAREFQSTARGFSRQALGVMLSYHWPGNVRELINRVRRAMVMTENRLLTSADLGLERRARERNWITLDRARSVAEGELIRCVLRHHSNNISETARQLGVSRATLYRLMTKLQISA